MAKQSSILNDPPQVLEGPRLLHKLIRWDQSPSDCALDFTIHDQRQKYSYQEIASCTASLSARIQDALQLNRDQSDHPQHVVPLLLPQAPCLYIAELAILESGGAFCPINLDAPKERIKFVVGDVQATLILTTAEFKDIVTWENGPTVILVDEFPSVPKDVLSSGTLPRIPSEKDLAYVMYTSGSSGLPKGVAVSHLAASQSLLAHERHIPSFKRFLQFAAPSFDVSVFEIFFPFTRGSTLVGCSRNQLLNDLPGIIVELDIDAAELTPTVVGSLLQKRANAPCLKLLLTIGEMLTTPIVEEFGGSKDRPNMLYGMYGPTEAAIHCTIYPKMEASAKPGNIGIPLDTVSTFIAAASTTADDSNNLEVLPIGELGELVLGGPQLADGYLNRPDQNKAAFVTFEGRNYYRTGDKARQLENGTIEILGRMSAGQVKLRGQRIELGEIEEIVYKHPGIKTVTAMVLENALVVFSLASEQNVNTEDILKTCAEWLPMYMVPSEVVVLTKFPYLPSGKVDKRKLEADYQKERQEAHTRGRVEAAAENPLTSTVRNIVQDTLGPLQKSSRLAAAGLDSLIAIKLASKLRLAGFDVTTLAILKAETLADLQQICESSKLTHNLPRDAASVVKTETSALALDGETEDIQSIIPCLPLQTAMLSETAMDSRMYWNWVELDILNANVNQVVVALEKLCEHNPILRSGFAESQDSNGYLQIIWKSLPKTSFKEVEIFEYESTLLDLTIKHPLQVQLRGSDGGCSLLLHLHHALYDAWSLELVLDDLNDLLLGKTLSPRPSFDSIVASYEDRSLLQDPWAAKDYWKDHISNLDIRNLPTFHSQKVISDGLMVNRHTTKILTSDIEKKARQLSCSPQSIFQAAYALILGSYLGSSDICFGTVFSGRTLPVAGIEDIVGPCLATLPVRIDTSTASTLQDLVQQLHSINRKHLEFSTLALRDIKAAGSVPARVALFDTLLIWQQTLHEYDHSREHVQLVDTIDNLELNLTIEIIPGNSCIELKANYKKSLLPETQVNVLLRQIEQTVRETLNNGSSALQEFSSNFDSQLLSTENLKPDTKIKPGTLATPVEVIADEDPCRLAIEFANSIDENGSDFQRVTYSELNIRANKIGHHLLAQNVFREVICICMEKSVNLYASILATAKLGAGYLPVTPDIPEERLHHILKEAKVRIVLAQSESRHLFDQDPSLLVIYVDEIDFSGLPAHNVPPRFLSESLAYCVYTSGSTGTPKGVMVTHGNLLSNLDVLEELYPATSDAKFLQSCSQAFDVSVFEIFFTWRIGACLCSAVKDVLFRDIEQAIRSFGVTHLSMTPTVAALINPENVPQVEFLVTAGEAVTQKVFNTWAGRGLYQGYGPSETTNICTVKPDVSKDDNINNIGPPLKNTSTFVLSPNADFNIVPRGGEGEFCFGGSQVFRGYMDTSKEIGKIINHPEYGRIYRSGDFGRLMPDGSLAFTGRKDDQIKIRGQRVELGEINNIMLTSDVVQDCVTMVIGESVDAQRLVCFWTPNSEPSDHIHRLDPDPSTLLILYNNLESALPAYMIPSSLIPISSLPSTAQSKIDKRYLIAMYKDLDLTYLYSTSRPTKRNSDQDWTKVQLTIAQVLSVVAKISIDDISLDTSFFGLGIDSISAIEFARKLRNELQQTVEISDVLKFSSVARLSEKLSSQLAEKSNINGTGISDVYDFGLDPVFIKSTADNFKQAGKTVQHIMPCTPLQEAMLSAGESSNESLYSNKVVFAVRGDAQKLEECWQEMARRHEMLRTCFVGTDMLRFPYVQVVLAEFKPSFSTVVDEGQISNNGDEFTPQYSLQLLQSDGATLLSMSIHHALYDGAALAILYEEIEALYNSKSLPSPVSFATFLQPMIRLDLEASDDFWQTTLGGCGPTILQNAIQSPTTSNETSARVQRLNSKISLTALEACGKKYNTSTLAICHTAWSSLLSEQLQQTDICFGNVVSGRTLSLEGIERLVAPCFNTIPSRINSIHKLTYLEAFRKLQNLNAESLPFQLSPLRRIQSRFSPDGKRLFDTLFILQQPAKELDPSIWSMEEEDGIMDFPFVCEVVPIPVNDSLEIILHTHCSSISSADAEKLLASFEEKLRTGLENPRRQILSTWVKDQIVAKETSQIERISESTESPISAKEMSPTELQLREIISNYTTVPRENIGRTDSIFRLGLDSISTVQVATRLRKQGYKVLASDVLEHFTIAKLNKFLGQTSESESMQISSFDFATFDKDFRQTITSKYSIDLSQVEAVRPCTAVQQGMLAQSLYSDGKEYVNTISFELKPQESLERLKVAWETICKDHEMLRTGFACTDDSKNPFIMVTFKKDDFLLPWSEEGHRTDNVPFTDQLLHRPWSLQVSQSGTQTFLTWKAHHALYDAQSLALVLSDVTSAYHTKPLSDKYPLEPLISAILAGSHTDEEAARQFWQSDANKIVVNRFPDLTPLRTSDTSSSTAEIFSVSTVQKLEEYCRKCGVTMQAAGQAAWARLLAAYIGESSTTFGLTLSGRSILEDADKIPFPSIVTLPVRSDVTGTNEDLLARIMGSNALLHKHQLSPLTNIQKWTGHPKGKMFDTLFAYQKIPDSTADVNCPWKIAKEEAVVDYAVSLEVQPVASGALALRLTFQNSLIPVEQSEILLRQYDSLLHDTLQNPHHASDVAPDCGMELLAITPAKEPVLPSSVTLLHQFVEDGAREWPDKYALEFATCLEPGNYQSKSWTYKELDQEANKVAHLLLKKSVLPGELIAICFDKCAEASIAIVGIMKAGCAYLALDPNAPVDRMKFIMGDSGAKLIMTAGNPGRNILTHLGGDIVLLDDPNVLDGYSTESPQLSRPITPEDTSYCLYTSGTTGTPKGCILTHSNAVQAMLAFQRLFTPHWTPSSKWLQFASFHFDVSVLEQFWSWSVGICVVSAPRDLIFEDIPSAIREMGVTHIDLTPSLARLVHPDDVPGLTKGVFITGGEQLKQEILDVWGEYACIYNGYGPTEATIGVTMYPRVPKNGKPSNIGPAFDNVGSFVLKPNTSLPVLRGGVGELCVSGMLVGKGYLNRPELTTERFPTLQGFDERVYRTGDLVRILHDNTFIFLGRADDQVKLRGQRLELSEINEVVKKSKSSLDEVVTLVLKHSTQQKEQLVTFLVSTEESSEDGNIIATVRDACKSALPGYMVPTHFIPIKAMPLNANNKADSKQLAALYNDLTIDDLQKLSRSSQQDESWSAEELPIVRELAKVLSVEPAAIVRGSNIFELGMDSISIIGFSRSLQNAGFSNAKLSTIMNNTSISALVQNLLSQKSIDPAKDAAYIAASQEIALFSQKHMVDICNELHADTAAVEKIAPCTPVQEGMIYRFLESENALYFNTFNFELRDKVDVEKLYNAWNVVTDNLEILRTSFVATDDGFAQVVMEPSAKIHDNCRQEVSFSGIDKYTALSKPWALTVQSKVMNLQAFHGLYDGNSMSMILQRVVQEYSRICGEAQTISYGPSFHESLPYGPLAKISVAKNFWEEHLKNWSPQEIPVSSTSGLGVIEVDDSVPNFEAFEDLRKSLGVSHQAIIQAVWMVVLQSKISRTITTTGIVISGRTIDFQYADDVIGPLFNTIPFHKQVPGMTWDSLITDCHKFNMELQDYAHTSLKDIQKWSPAGVGQSLFEALFVFQRPQAEEMDFAKNLWTEKSVPATADYPIALEATLNPDMGSGSVLALKLVAQASALSDLEARDLLSEARSLLLALLQDRGSIVLENLENIQQEPVNGARLTRQPSDEMAANSSFEWTTEAQLVRAEIASLSGSDEKDIHPQSSIFELGLDSIDVIKLTSRLRKGGVILPVSAIIKHQTIQGMVAAIPNTHSKETSSSQTGYIEESSKRLAGYLKQNGIIPSDFPTESVLPATPLQEGMYHLMIQSDYEMYFNVDAFRLHHNTNPDALIQAVSEVVKQSPIFSTVFAPVDDPQIPTNYAQIIRDVSFFDTLGLKFDTWDKEMMSEASLEELRSSAAQRAKNNQELFQVKFLTIGALKYMVIAVAHALYDGFSIQSFHADIQQVYLGQPLSRTDPRPFLEEVFKSTTEEAKKFWRSTLANLPVARFPRNSSDEESAPIQVYRATQTSEVSLSCLQESSKAANVSLQTLGQTCWALVLAQLMGQLDVVFGTVLSCRDLPKSDQVMFPLMNTVAVRSVLHGNLDEMLKYMQAMSNTTRQYQHFPLGEAQAIALSSRKGVKDTTFFDTLFIYQGRRTATDAEPLYESEYSHADVDFPVCVEMEINENEQIVWTTACKSSVRTEVETHDILKALDHVLQQIVESRQTPTFSSDTNGTSICKLPSIQLSDASTKSTTESRQKSQRDSWSENELAIREALQEVSGVPDESIHKDTTIFELGLDSISVHKLHKSLKSRDMKLSVSSILKGLTIDAMAQSLNAAESAPAVVLNVDAVISQAMADFKYVSEPELGNVKQFMPVTAGQEYMLRGWQVSQGVLFYPTFFYKLSKDLFDEQQLKRAWDALVQQHDILRTGFIESGGKLYQVVLSEVESSFRRGDSSSRPDTAINGRPPVAIIAGPSMSSFGLQIHHALYDASSIELLMNELTVLYCGEALKAPKSDFRSFVAHSISSIQEDKWRSHFTSDIKETLLPASILPSAKRTKLFKPDLGASGAKSWAKKHGITTDAFFLSIIARIFARRTNSSTAQIFGIYLANRNAYQEDFSLMVAPTLNLVPMVVKDPLTLDTSSQNVAAQVQDELRQISHADMSSASLQHIYDWTGVRVNCFVNILKDLDLGISPSQDGDEDSINFDLLPQIFEEEAPVTQSTPEKLNTDAYLESLDIEIKFHDNDTVDIGVFGPGSLISHQDAEAMIEEFQNGLREILGEKA
ncbi:hypothetical protein BP6252_08445 [Coleophoma cylindrospora]|uniref:Carrier domain-containing protein n=1 Tax=Coleophoma cylindrospora TaxID=1849047 RepID=A0A3D8R5U9_9HELO|nr:hypothetical protein BP6252_08445 [Coleophoma cylindrospora]